MATPTRTIGPLHLEDLDPHRFEDLVRQLLYDFRPWRMLESTGRTGADEGFDARGWEAIGGDADQSDDSDPDDEGVVVTQEDRLWLIQAKREKAIGPKKLVKYLNDIPEPERKQIYGIVFVAACEFSKTARDQFRETIRSFGFSEGHLWGKGEVEDQLFQPKNDHLLFAYFGISLQARRRSLKTEVRARLATKRKAKRILDQSYGQVILIRDASDDRYPFQDPDETLERVDRRRWRTYIVEKCGHDGIYVCYSRHMAYVDDDGMHWDYAETVNEARSHIWDDPWEPREATSKHWDEASTIWHAL